MSARYVLLRSRFAFVGAPLDPDEEEHDDEDREGDEADQAKERREVSGRPEPPSSPAPAALGGDGLGLDPLRLLPGRCVLLVEEVEVENVVVARTHAPLGNSR